MSIAREIARGVDELYALYDDPEMTPEKATQQQLARLSAKQLSAFIARIEAGEVHGHGPDAEVQGEGMLAAVFTVRELSEEAERRGLPPLVIGPPKGKG